MIDAQRSALLHDLEKSIGYSFSDLHLLDEATTHPSSNAGFSNQRLEFLGDAVLGLLVGRILYDRFPDDAEGNLTRRKAALVSTDALAEVAQGLQLGRYLVVGEGEELMGGRKKRHILEDLVEAVVGAVYLDGGYDAAQHLVETLFTPRVETLPAVQQLTDAKTTLQELVQAVPNHRISYRTTGVAGPPHAPVFTVELLIDDQHVVGGTGPSRRKAEQQAAGTALQRFNELVAPKLSTNAN